MNVFVQETYKNRKFEENAGTVQLGKCKETCTVNAIMKMSHLGPEPEPENSFFWFTLPGP